MLTYIVRVTLVRFGEKIFIGKYLMTLEVKVRHFGTTKSKMAPKIQDGGRKFWILLTKKLDMDPKNSQKKLALASIMLLVKRFQPVLQGESGW